MSADDQWHIPLTSSKKQETKEAPKLQLPWMLKETPTENRRFFQTKKIISTRVHCSAMQFLFTWTQASSSLNDSSWQTRALRTQRKPPYKTPQPFMLFLSFILKPWELKQKSTKMSKTSITMTITVMDKQIWFAIAHSQHKTCPQLGKVQLYQVLTASFIRCSQNKKLLPLLP